MKTTKDTQPTNSELPLGKINYYLILGGVALIILGFILLSGGGSDDPEVFNYEMFNFRRLYIAPILLLAGFLLPIYAIMYRPKKKKE